MKVTYGSWYWPAWLAATVVTFLVVEVYALASGHSENTLSDWVWRTLKITSRTTVSTWSAADALSFGVWVVLITWLTFHLWLRKYT